MRKRVERRIRKRLRLTRNRELATSVAEYERAGLVLEAALSQVVSVRRRGCWLLGDAARLLDLARPGTAVRLLLERYFSVEDPIEIADVALGLEQLGDPRCLGPLCAALNDPILMRRRWAAYVFGWLRAPGWIQAPRSRVVASLIDVLVDPRQPPDVRGQAVESLRYLGARKAVPAMLSVLHDPEPGVRWWACFGLGGELNRCDSEVVSALAERLSDDVVPEGEQYSVGQEALGVLGSMDPSGTHYRMQLKMRLQPIYDNPADWSEQDRNWAATWGR